MKETIENIETIAKNYSSKGLIPIPIVRGEKKPLVENWSILSPEELLQSFRKFQNCNIGIRLDGLTVLDIERPELWGLFFAPHPEEVAKKTLVSKTGGGGYHVYFRGETKPERANGFAELRSGSKQYVVVPPSLHPSGKVYEWISNFESVNIEQLKPELFEEAREKIKTLNQFGSFIIKMVEVWKSKHRHQLALWLSGYLRKIGIPKEKAETIIACIVLLAGDEEINDRLRALQDSYEEEENNLKGYSGLIEELETIIGSERVKEFIEVLPKPLTKHREAASRKIKVKYVFGGETFNGSLLELIKNAEGAIKILRYDLASGKYEVMDEVIVDDGRRMRPYKNLPYEEYLPTIPNLEYEDSTLWYDTIKFLKEYYEHFEEVVYHVMAATIAWSYFVNSVGYSTPYLCFIGPFRSGKTKALEVMASLSYKPFIVVDPTESSIFRLVETIHPTLFIDESHILNQNIRSIIASGYRKGAKIPRVVDPEARGLTGIKWFETFGLKVFASREELPNDIFSRCILVHSEKNVKPIKKKIDMKEALELRTRWLAKKLRNFDKIQVNYDEFQSDDARIQELFSPLAVMARFFGDETAIKMIEKYGRLTEKEIKAMETSSDDALIVEGLVDFVSSNEVLEVSIAELTEFINIHLKQNFTTKYVSRRLRTLGFQRIRMHDGARGFRIDLDLLFRLARRYEIPFNNRENFINYSYQKLI